MCLVIISNPCNRDVASTPALQLRFTSPSGVSNADEDGSTGHEFASGCTFPPAGPLRGRYVYWRGRGAQVIFIEQSHVATLHSNTAYCEFDRSILSVHAHPTDDCVLMTVVLVNGGVFTLRFPAPENVDTDGSAVSIFSEGVAGRQYTSWGVNVAPSACSCAPDTLLFASADSAVTAYVHPGGLLLNVGMNGCVSCLPLIMYNDYS